MIRQLYVYTSAFYLHLFVTVTNCNKSCLHISKDDFDAFQFYDIVTFVLLYRDCEED